MTGSEPGPYEILSAIGFGGMGSAYKAKGARLGRTVAVMKVKETHSESFKREAPAISKIIHRASYWM